MSDQKPTNPKDAMGSDKMPLDLVPDTAIALESLAFLDGKGKYGGNNWRAHGARAAVYIAAVRRHITLWNQGEENDPESGVHHLGHARACLAILIETQMLGNLTDDRPYPAPYRAFVDKWTPLVAKIKQRHADKSPHHYTIRDAPPMKEVVCPKTRKKKLRSLAPFTCLSQDDPERPSPASPARSAARRSKPAAASSSARGRAAATTSPARTSTDDRDDSETS